MNSHIRLLIVAGLLTGTALSQSLGDIARQNRQTKRKPAARVYTDDDIAPKRNNTSSSDPDDTKDAAGKGKNVKGAPDDAEKKSEDPDEATKKQWDDFKKRVAEQRGKVDLAQRELDVLQKEAQLQIASYNSSVMNRLGGQQEWADKQRKSEEAAQAKTKELQDAKDALQAILDEAKKSGVPSSYTE